MISARLLPGAEERKIGAAWRATHTCRTALVHSSLRTGEKCRL